MKNNNLHNDFGKLGERLALKYVSAHGFKIIQSNFSCRLGEIDIIALQKDILVIIEVKSRNNLSSVDTLDSITYKKRQRISRATLEFISLHPEYDEFAVRFDVITVTKHKYYDEYSIKHYEDFFDTIIEYNTIK